MPFFSLKMHKEQQGIGQISETSFLDEYQYIDEIPHICSGVCASMFANKL